MKLATIVSISIVPFISLANNPASAATAWFFNGECYESRVKWGTLDEDLTKEVGDPIRCKVAVLLQLRNGRTLIDFITGRGALGFGGSSVDRKTNALRLDRIYPIRDVQGMSSNEIIAGAGKSALEGAEGFCFFSTRTLSCVSKYETDTKKTVYSIKMKVRKVTKRANFPDF